MPDMKSCRLCSIFYGQRLLGSFKIFESFQPIKTFSSVQEYLNFKWDCLSLVVVVDPVKHKSLKIPDIGEITKNILDTEISIILFAYIMYLS